MFSLTVTVLGTPGVGFIDPTEFKGFEIHGIARRNSEEPSFAPNGDPVGLDRFERFERCGIGLEEEIQVILYHED